jgi:hypothetical protein
LSDYDSETVDYFDEIQVYLNVRFKKEDIDELGTMISNYEFDDALEVLRNK